MVYDPVGRQRLDEALCARVPAGDGWVLLRAPEGHWFAHRPWTGATRPLAGPAEEDLVAARDLGERLLQRCALLPQGRLDEGVAAARLQERSRDSRYGAAVCCARDAGFAADVVLRALDLLDREPADEELLADVRVVRLADLVG